MTDAQPDVAVVDDEPDIGDIIGRTLKRNYQVDIYESALDFFEALERNGQYDVILCDIYMPEVSGREVYQRLAEQWPDQAERLVFMTGASAAEARHEVLSDLDVRMIEKPFRLDTLRTVVRQVAGQ